MTSQTDRQALERARDEATADAIRQLRTFTGIPGYTPLLTEPEHRAYLAYAKDLERGVEVWTNHLNARQAHVDRLTEQLAEANRVLADERRRRESERSDHVGGKILGALQDVTFPEKRDVQALDKAVAEAWESRHEAEDRVTEILNELGRVSAWIDTLFDDVDAARAAHR